MGSLGISVDIPAAGAGSGSARSMLVGTGGLRTLLATQDARAAYCASRHDSAPVGGVDVVVDGAQPHPLHDAVVEAQSQLVGAAFELGPADLIPFTTQSSSRRPSWSAPRSRSGRTTLAG